MCKHRFCCSLGLLARFMQYCTAELYSDNLHKHIIVLFSLYEYTLNPNLILKKHQSVNLNVIVQVLGLAFFVKKSGLQASIKQPTIINFIVPADIELTQYILF